MFLYFAFPRHQPAFELADPNVDGKTNHTNKNNPHNHDVCQLKLSRNHDHYAKTREEILAMIWEMEEEIMGRTEESA
jgi:hypothetical protein